ncbi:MAG: membrane protein required for colicin V production [Woeseiaceae bacterium]|jgi:membrane protein required for colicin V production
MAIVDLVIILAALASLVVGFIRGIVREAIAIASLLIAIWAAMNLGPHAGSWFENSIGSTELQMWAGRSLVFIIILAVGALGGWGISKIIRMSGLTGIDRALGAFFGAIRAVLILGLFVLTGRYAGFYDYDWWHDSAIIPLGDQVADWISVMAPRGMELFQPENLPDELAL